MIGLNIITPATVITWIGSNVLAMLADVAGGGTVTVKTQKLYAPPATPRYRYLISFKHRNGKTYGPYIYNQQKNLEIRGDETGCVVRSFIES